MKIFAIARMLICLGFLILVPEMAGMGAEDGVDPHFEDPFTGWNRRPRMWIAGGDTFQFRMEPGDRALAEISRRKSGETRIVTSPPHFVAGTASERRRRQGRSFQADRVREKKWDRKCSS